MYIKSVMNKYARGLLLLALPLLFAGPVLAESVLKPQPALTTTAATKAMMPSPPTMTFGSTCPCITQWTFSPDL